MKLIAGLGNYGDKYEYTRHNIGFLILDDFIKSFKKEFYKGRGDWLESKLIIDEEEIYLIKPLTYMNRSGVAIKEFIDKANEGSSETGLSRIRNIDILVIVDDFNIKTGSIRVRKKGSDGGHNGLSNIIYHLNSDEFPRMRVGIGNDELMKNVNIIDYVLGEFTDGELETGKKLSKVYNDCILSFIKHGLTKTMNSFNKSFIQFTQSEQSGDKPLNGNNPLNLN